MLYFIVLIRLFYVSNETSRCVYTLFFTFIHLDRQYIQGKLVLCSHNTVSTAQCQTSHQHRKEAHAHTAHCAWTQNRSISHRKSFEVIPGLLKFNDSMKGEIRAETRRRKEDDKEEKEREKESVLLPSSHLLISEESFPYSQ